MAYLQQTANIPAEMQMASITGLTYYLMQKQVPAGPAIVKSLPGGRHVRKLSQRAVITMMAARLGSSVHRKLSEMKKKKVFPRTLTDEAAKCLKMGLSVDETIEKLERF